MAAKPLNKKPLNRSRLIATLAAGAAALALPLSAQAQVQVQVQAQDHGGHDRGEHRGRNGSGGNSGDGIRNWSGGDGPAVWQGDRQRAWNSDNDRNRDRDRTWQRDRDRDGGRDRRDQGSGSAWTRDWRQDHRYDWQGWRNDHREVYRIGRYTPPQRRFGYRRLGIGVYLEGGFFGSRYWLDDPWMYRLPSACGACRWVRYYDDALMVNVYTGEVVDVVYSVFW